MRDKPLKEHPLCLALSVVSLTALASGAPPIMAQPAEPGDPNVFDNFRALGEQVDGLDWDREYPRMERALRNIWAQNGWDDEADRYAFELASELAAIPPWQPAKRLDLLTTRLAERYSMGKDDAERFKSMVVREVGGVLLRNAGSVFEHAREALDARASGKPYTAEQVARWTKSSAPLRADVRMAADRLTTQLDRMLKPEARRILRQDTESYRKRLKRFDEMTKRWEQGAWQPEDWGLQHDPVQTGMVEDANAGRTGREDSMPPGARSARPPIPRWKPEDPATWFAYVLDFKKRFNLDPGQMTTVDSIHAELLARANNYITAHAQRLAKVGRASRATDDAYEPVRGLFEELQERLDAVPRSGQREAAQP